MKDDLLWVYEGPDRISGRSAHGAQRTANAASSGAKILRSWWRRTNTGRARLAAAAGYGRRGAVSLRRRTTSGPTGAGARIFTKKASCCGWTWTKLCGRLTNDKKSINDFCRIFHGGPGGEPELKTYTFEDVVAALNSVAPYDWAGFLRARLDGVATKTPSEAIENSGWKLVYNDQPNEMLAMEEALARRADFDFSVGFTASDEGVVGDVIHGGPAYNAGIGPGMKIVAVNGAQYSPDGMRGAIDAAKVATEPIQLIVANGAQFRTVLRGLSRRIAISRILNGTKANRTIWAKSRMRRWKVERARRIEGGGVSEMRFHPIAIVGILLVAAGIAALIHPQVAMPGHKEEVQVGTGKAIIETRRIVTFPWPFSALLILAGAGQVFLTCKVRHRV